MKKILITGGDGRFASELRKVKTKFKLIFCGKKELDICSQKSINKNFSKYKPNYVLHLAGLSRPMKIHEKNIEDSILTNIIGTANIVRVCKKLSIKLIYFSTNYVYPCTNGNYKETDALLPINNYGWSKLGGECAVQMLKNSLILRLAITDFPFNYNKAIKNAYSSFIYNKDFAKVLPNLINEKGVLNIGGKRQSIYNFAKKMNPKIKSIMIKKNSKFPKDSSLNVKRFNQILKKNDK